MNDRAVAVIVQNRCLLVIHRQKPGKDYYVLPGGSVEQGETPEIACVREAQEETGLAVTLEEKLWTYNNGGRTEHYFLVTVEGGTLQLGYPEAERQSPDNRYTLEWIDAERLAQINLQPADVRDVVALER
jgi:8-oxo-dGTP pyrophosphatase MutT (NUDIX family)